MIVYFDTSALVKLYVSERHSRDVQLRAHRADAVATSMVAYAEARAAFARALLEEATTAAAHSQRVAQFNRDWGELLRIELHPTVARNAGELAEIHQLRGFDAIHLASALWLRDRSDEDCEFVAFDARLLAGARSVGLEIASIGRG